MAVDLPAESLSRDTFHNGRLLVWQKKAGYRFSLDAPLLAYFLEGGREPAVEFGCGCGIVSLLALVSGKFKSIRAFEIQEDLCGLARLNARENGLADRLLVEQADFRAVASSLRGVETLFGNPPFYALGRGRVSGNEEVRAAKFEISLPLPDMLAAAAAVLAAYGSLSLVYPAARFPELIAEARGHGLYCRRRRAVKSFPTGKAERFLVELRKSKAGQIEMKPLVIFSSQGVYTAEMNEILTGKGNAD